MKRRRRLGFYGLPGVGVDIFTSAHFIGIFAYLRIEAHAAFGAGDFKEQAVDVAGHPPGGLDAANCAVGEFDGHHGSVISIELIFADAVARRFLKGL